MNDKKAALDMALKQIEKQFGTGSIIKMGEGTHTKVEASSSGSLALDIALGINGYPKGRIMEVYG
ncbi:DNA recombination/repair protein RecA, partial [Priestia megaterium]|nr:DNA recombination/repair protein RecA [Priestia megaterium]